VLATTSGPQFLVEPTPDVYTETGVAPYASPQQSGLLKAKYKIIPTTGGTGKVKVQVEAWATNDYAGTAKASTGGTIIMSCNTTTGARIGTPSSEGGSSDETGPAIVWNNNGFTYARRVRIVSTVTTADMSTNNPKITVSATVTLQEGPVAIDGSVSWGTSETVSITGFAELEIVAQ
jgi:hypothetical protein